MSETESLSKMLPARSSTVCLGLPDYSKPPNPIGAPHNGSSPLITSPAFLLRSLRVRKLKTSLLQRKPLMCEVTYRLSARDGTLLSNTDLNYRLSRSTFLFSNPRSLLLLAPLLSGRWWDRLELDTFEAQLLSLLGARSYLPLRLETYSKSGGIAPLLSRTLGRLRAMPDLDTHARIVGFSLVLHYKKPTTSPPTTSPLVRSYR